MSRRISHATIDLYMRLDRIGFDRDDTDQLRRIERTLSRWSEQECGDENGNAIERDETTGKPFRTYDRGNKGERGRYQIPDREAGALRRLAALMANHPEFIAYHQGDPRGCAVYIVRKADIHEGENIDSVYSRGWAVCA